MLSALLVFRMVAFPLAVLAALRDLLVTKKDTPPSFRSSSNTTFSHIPEILPPLLPATTRLPEPEPDVTIGGSDLFFVEDWDEYIRQLDNCDRDLNTDHCYACGLAIQPTHASIPISQVACRFQHGSPQPTTQSDCEDEPDLIWFGTPSDGTEPVELSLGEMAELEREGLAELRELMHSMIDALLPAGATFRDVPDHELIAVMRAGALLYETRSPRD